MQAGGLIIKGLVLHGSDSNLAGDSGDFLNWFQAGI